MSGAHRSGPPRPTDPSGLERYYVLTGGRSGPGGPAAGLDVATLVVSRSASAPAPGMQHEHEKIVRWCRDPLSAAELSAHLGLPFNILAVLVADLLEAGLVDARDPIPASTPGHGADIALLEEVLSGLQRL
ncbi:DUF742 domain-containing protein [Streptomyces sp. NPDC057302]|uniref:DUF742 domain-containing protein n=1 Tax=Streptomyces sp. NPDC057302 TaxID=3346094 RepID=UPI00363364C8